MEDPKKEMPDSRTDRPVIPEPIYAKPEGLPGAPGRISPTDPQGSYTGRPTDGTRPVQDADDL